MSDSNVLAAQKYLNKLCEGNPLWIHLTEDGKTGTATMQGIIRAFQLQNGVPNPTGNLGPNTINKMKSLSPISKMNANDQPNVNVCLIQCALFCKGYAAGGITGIYYTNGVNAVKAMQADAGLPVTGIIDWKVWAGLLSLNWFILASSGDSKLRKIQQQLNADYSDIIGVCPCDGIKSRVTALSLLGALQAEEGVTTEYVFDLNTLNFGENTTNAFVNNVGFLMNGKNGEDVIPYNKIVQYALYLYECNNYENDFDGIFDITTQSAVSTFQNKYKLLDVGLQEEVGVVGVSTMKSLLTSKGDINRFAAACDTSTCLNMQQALDLKNAGYQVVGRYLTGTVGWGESYRSKALSKEEIELLKNVGLRVFPIYQDGGNKLSYFKRKQQGYYDAVTAIKTAKQLGFTSGTTIYFAVDFDCLQYEAEDYILPYFQQLNLVFTTNPVLNNKGYQIGIYAPRLICTMVSEAGYATYSFVSDMSTGFSGNLGYPIPNNWSFDQFYETTFNSTPNFKIDKVAYSGRDIGCTTFDETSELTNTQLLQNARNDFAMKFLKSFSAIAERFGTEFTFDGQEIPIATFADVNSFVKISFKGGEVMQSSDKKMIMSVGFDQDGNFSQEMLDTFQIGLNEMLNQEEVEKITNIINEMAISIGFGNFEITLFPTTTSEFHLEFSAYTDDLYQYYGVHGAVFAKLIVEVTILPNYQFDGKTVESLDLQKMLELNVAQCTAVCYSILSYIVDYLVYPLLQAIPYVTAVCGILYMFGLVLIAL